MLIVMAGLPGSGKSMIARALAARLPAAVVAVDAIDAALRRAGIGADEPTGLAAYLAAEAVAEDVLAAGLTVLIDAVNAVEPARAQWRDLAARRAVPMRVVDVGRRRAQAGRVRPVEDAGHAAARARLDGRPGGRRGYGARPPAAM